MYLLMPALTRAPNGDHFSRKVIPRDVRDAYERAYGVRQEARFRLSREVPIAGAKVAHREWADEINGRIDRLRAAAAGKPSTLSARELHQLSARWYVWFVTSHEEDPGTVELWEHAAEQLEDVWQSAGGIGHPDEPEDEPIGRGHRRRIRAKLQELAQVPSFLAVEGLALADESLNLFLDEALPADLGPALQRLRLLAAGRAGADAHLATLDASPRKAKSSSAKAGLTAWEAFGAWVAERKPADQTVNRWRGVIEHLDLHFGGKDVADYTPEDAVAWKDALVQAGKASARTINEVWLTAARRIFGWVVEQRRLASNPFIKVKVAGTKVKGSKGEFTEDAISAILGASLSLPPSRESAQLRAAKRWIPWLCAYTGSRPGEIAQLRGSDVTQHRAGFWTLRITPEAGTVKGSVARTVVLHEHLVEQGFPAFALSAGEAPMFYVARAASEPHNPLKPRRAPYVVARNKVGEWVRKDVGVTDASFSPSHSWRHTFKRRAARPPANIEQRLRDAICGHSDDSAKAVYETPTIEDIAEAIARFPRYEISKA